MDHLVHHLAHRDSRHQHLQALAGILQGQQQAHQHNRDGAGIGNQGGETDRHGKQHAVGNAHQGEDNYLQTAEDQGQHHLAGEVTAEGAIEGAGDQAPHPRRQPFGQAGGDPLAPQQKKHGEHQHYYSVHGEAQRGPEQTEHLLAELAGQFAGAADQIAAEVAEIGGQTLGHRPLLQLAEQAFALGQPAGQGGDQLIELGDQPRQQPQHRQHHAPEGHTQHQQEGQGSGQSLIHQPAAGQIQQKGQQGSGQKQGREGCQRQQQLAHHPEIEHQQRQGQAEPQPGGQHQSFEHGVIPQAIWAR